MILWHFSDTHGHHLGLNVPKCDLAIFSGDESNDREPSLNQDEFFNFIHWFGKLDIKHKVFIPGNHSSWVSESGKMARRICENRNIHFLINEAVEIEGLKIWGSPFTPSFHDWFFMRDRGSLHKTWALVPDDCEILVTHGPPKGILDLSENMSRELEQVGDSSLLNRILQLKELKLHCHGHLHEYRSCFNQGILIQNGIHFSNASCVTNQIEKGISSHGNLFSIDKDKKVSYLAQ